MDAKTLGAQPSSHCAGFYSDIGSADHFGLTKRELFSAMAMQGLCADPSNHKLFDDAEDMAENAVYIADCILAQLAKDQP